MLDKWMVKIEVGVEPFPAPTGRGRALSDSGLSKLLRENDIPGTVHGMRASFRSWAAEQGIPREWSA